MSYEIPEDSKRWWAWRLFTPVTIYTLACPLTNEIYYVGCTCHPLEKRLKSGHRWLKRSNDLLAEGLTPVIEEIDTTIWAYRATLERYWIAQLRAWGMKLDNKPLGKWNKYKDACAAYWKYMHEFPDEQIKWSKPAA